MVCRRINEGVGRSRDQGEGGSQSGSTELLLQLSQQLAFMITKRIRTGISGVGESSGFVHEGHQARRMSCFLQANDRRAANAGWRMTKT